MFLLNLLLGYGLSEIWGVLNALQIVAFHIYIEVMIPTNVSVFFEFIMDMADFNIISKEEIYQIWPSLEEKGFLDFSETTFYEQFGPYLIYFSILIVAIGFVAIIAMLAPVSHRAMRIYLFCHRMIFWQGTLRQFFESYIEVMYFTLSSVVLIGKETDLWLSQGLNSLVLVVYLIIPYKLQKYFRRLIEERDLGLKINKDKFRDTV